jgi:hypothetical protein
MSRAHCTYKAIDQITHRARKARTEHARRYEQIRVTAEQSTSRVRESELSTEKSQSRAQSTNRARTEHTQSTEKSSEQTQRTEQSSIERSTSRTHTEHRVVAVLCGTALCKLNAINDFILQVRLSGKAL